MRPFLFEIIVVPPPPPFPFITSKVVVRVFYGLMAFCRKEIMYVVFLLLSGIIIKK